MLNFKCILSHRDEKCCVLGKCTAKKSGAPCDDVANGEVARLCRSWGLGKQGKLREWRDICNGKDVGLIESCSSVAGLVKCRGKRWAGKSPC